MVYLENLGNPEILSSLCPRRRSLKQNGDRQGSTAPGATDVRRAYLRNSTEGHRLSHHRGTSVFQSAERSGHLSALGGIRWFACGAHGLPTRVGHCGGLRSAIRYPGTLPAARGSAPGPRSSSSVATRWASSTSSRSLSHRPLPPTRDRADRSRSPAATR